MKILLFFILFPAIFFANEPFYSFILPKKWDVVSTKDFSESIKLGCVAKSKNNIKPSLNLATEKTKASFDEYIMAVKERHTAQRKNNYSSLGFLNLKAGKAYLSQIDTKTKCGDVRTLQCLFLKDNRAYILTGVCEKGDFLDSYDQFISAFESFELAKTPFESIKDLSKENQLKSEIETVKLAWTKLKDKNPSKDPSKLFLDKGFQKKVWKGFEKFIAKTFKEKGLIWHIQTSTFVKNQICT